MEIVISIHNILEKTDQKSKISSFIKETLYTHFSHRLFYLADFSKIITPTDEQVKQFETYLIARLSPPPPDSLVRRVPLRYPNATPVDQYIHYCIQHNHSIPSELKSTILSLDPYYQWLLAPETFDYSNFTPQWLQHDLSKASPTSINRAPH